MLDSALAQFRVAAAQASGGTSNEMIYKAVLHNALSRVSSGDVLDLGAGTGNLLFLLYEMRRFSRIVGADMLPRPGNLPDEVAWIQQDLNDPIALPDESFDTVLAVELIEHLENPRALARELYRLLRPTGVAVLSTPNNESWRSLLALLFRGHFVAFTDPCYPAHLTALVRKDLQRILS